MIKKVFTFFFVIQLAGFCVTIFLCKTSWKSIVVLCFADEMFPVKQLLGLVVGLLMPMIANVVLQQSMCQRGRFFSLVRGKVGRTSKKKKSRIVYYTKIKTRPNISPSTLLIFSTCNLIHQKKNIIMSFLKTCHNMSKQTSEYQLSFLLILYKKKISMQAFSVIKTGIMNRKTKAKH